MGHPGQAQLGEAFGRSLIQHDLMGRFHPRYFFQKQDKAFRRLRLGPGGVEGPAESPGIPYGPDEAVHQIVNPDEIQFFPGAFGPDQHGLSGAQPPKDVEGVSGVEWPEDSLGPENGGRQFGLRQQHLLDQGFVAAVGSGLEGAGSLLIEKKGRGSAVDAGRAAENVATDLAAPARQDRLDMKRREAGEIDDGVVVALKKKLEALGFVPVAVEAVDLSGKIFRLRGLAAMEDRNRVSLFKQSLGQVKADEASAP